MVIFWDEFMGMKHLASPSSRPTMPGCQVLGTKVVQRRTLRRASLWRGCREPMIPDVVDEDDEVMSGKHWKFHAKICSQCANCWKTTSSSSWNSIQNCYLFCLVDFYMGSSHGHVQRLLGVGLEMIQCWVNLGLVYLWPFCFTINEQVRKSQLSTWTLLQGFQD